MRRTLDEIFKVEECAEYKHKIADLEAFLEGDCKNDDEVVGWIEETYILLYRLAVREMLKDIYKEVREIFTGKVTEETPIGFLLKGTYGSIRKYWHEVAKGLYEEELFVETMYRVLIPWTYIYNVDEEGCVLYDLVERLKDIKVEAIYDYT